jgi:hypothetical protein
MDVVEINTDFTEDIKPGSTASFDLGKSDKRWSAAYIEDWTKIGTIRPSGAFIDANNYKVIWGDAYNQTLTELFQNSYFDFIIDDGPHTLESQLYTSTNYFKKLKINGLLIIEDIFDFDYVSEIENHVKNTLPSDSYEFKCFDFRKSKNRFDDVIIEIKRLK